MQLEINKLYLEREDRSFLFIKVYIKYGIYLILVL